ncbi:hypothetical protein EQG63_11425 [Flavobacterium amnicola]|uniref:Uncharacterized protein n=1 Tax=Flavobacterium amnicola TaxID=2506422 RepID=A0A4Q1K0G6_9FLAO|nr:hypothetical protein [Flavobacterium amnicola]RXR16230.1 hypothetical protein EQG63_11425 [Flavobacterium amnicola]
MATLVITIRLDDSGSGLELNDGQSNGPHITTRAAKRDTIKWKLIPNSGIDELLEIQIKDFDVFEQAPSRQPDGSLIGQIGDYPEGTTANYAISYSVNGRQQVHDPKILIRA